MSIEHFHPFAGDHAIQSAIVVVEWGAPDGSGHLTAERMQAIQAAALPQLVSLGLTQSEQIRVMEVQFGPNAAAANPSQSIGGFKATRPSSQGGELRSLLMARERCIIEINDYTRWAQARLDIQQYLNVVLPMVCASVPVLQLNLQFNDVFWWRAPAAELNLTEVFRHGSAWLPPHVFGLNNLWHSHHGYFSDCTEPCAFKQLDNVNVSRALINGTESIQALIAHRATPAAPLWIKEPFPEGHQITLILDKFHADNKCVLTELFTDEVLRKIKMMPG